MNGKVSSDLRVNQKQAKLLLDEAYMPLIKLLFVGSYATSELVEKLGSDMNRVFYQLRQLESAGLIKVTATSKQRGREIKHYSMTEKNYFVPFEVTDAATIQEFILGPIMARQQAFGDRIEHILLRNGAGKDMGFEVGLVKGEYGLVFKGDENVKKAPIFSYWQPVRLPPERGHELAARMQALLQEFDVPDGKLFTVVFQMVAEED